MIAAFKYLKGFPIEEWVIVIKRLQLEESTVTIIIWQVNELLKKAVRFSSLEMFEQNLDSHFI